MQPGVPGSVTGGQEMARFDEGGSMNHAGVPEVATFGAVI